MSGRIPAPACCGEPMEHLGSSMWQCDPCGCLLAVRGAKATDRRPCPDHNVTSPTQET